MARYDSDSDLVTKSDEVWHGHSPLSRDSERSLTVCVVPL
jgi:hypothetical protein